MPLTTQPPIPGYEPVRLLGINLGTVYLARHSDSGTLVALKVFHRRVAAHVGDLYAPLARLDHPNIIRVLGFGDFEEYSYCALEYVKNTLADHLLQGPLPAVEVARLTQAVASAVQYAADQGMILSTLTPTEILLSEENIPKLADLHTRHASGKSATITPPSVFMAPEEVQGNATRATDVYRVGAVMYTMLTGEPPFPNDGGMEATLRRVIGERPKSPRQMNPKVSRDLEAVCMRCLEKRPEARYASLHELADKLKLFLESSY